MRHGRIKSKSAFSWSSFLLLWRTALHLFGIPSDWIYRSMNFAPNLWLSALNFTPAGRTGLLHVAGRAKIIVVQDLGSTPSNKKNLIRTAPCLMVVQVLWSFSALTDCYCWIEQQYSGEQRHYHKRQATLLLAVYITVFPIISQWTWMKSMMYWLLRLV